MQKKPPFLQAADLRPFRGCPAARHSRLTHWGEGAAVDLPAERTVYSHAQIMQK